MFFDEPAEFGGGRYWDGAITGCNNPILAAVTEAIVLGADPKSIAALSIGTATASLLGPPTNPASPIQQARPDQSLVNDLAKLAASVTDEPPEIARRDRVGWAFTFAMAAYNFVRLPKLVAGAAA
jgi:hypothetical protein